jgi:hypothetical protein
VGDQRAIAVGGRVRCINLMLTHYERGKLANPRDL